MPNLIEHAQIAFSDNAMKLFGSSVQIYAFIMSRQDICTG